MTHRVVVDCRKKGCETHYSQFVEYSQHMLVASVPYVCGACGSSDINVSINMRKFREAMTNTDLSQEQ